MALFGKKFEYAPDEQLLERLSMATGITNPNELIDKALSIMEWALKAERNGDTIVSGKTQNNKVVGLNGYIKVGNK